MDQEKLNNQKIVLLQEKIRQAAIDGTLESKRSAFKMESVELGLSDADFNKLIENGKEQAKDTEKVKKFAQKNKIWITILVVVLIAIEWILNIHTEDVVSVETEELMKHTSLHIGVIWMLIINFITALASIIIISIIYRKKNKTV